jgi:hypothetical protein
MRKLDLPDFYLESPAFILLGIVCSNNSTRALTSTKNLLNEEDEFLELISNGVLSLNEASFPYYTWKDLYKIAN